MAGGSDKKIAKENDAAVKHFMTVFGGAVVGFGALADIQGHFCGSFSGALLTWSLGVGALHIKYHSHKVGSIFNLAIGAFCFFTLYSTAAAGSPVNTTGSICE